MHPFVKEPRESIWERGKHSKEQKKKKNPSDSENFCLCLKQKTVFDVALHTAQYNLAYIHKLQ